MPIMINDYGNYIMLIDFTFSIQKLIQNKNKKLKAFLFLALNSLH